MDLADSQETFRVGGSPNFVRAADLDRDGDLDLAVANWGLFGGTPGLSVLFNDGEGEFSDRLDLNVEIATTCVVPIDLGDNNLPDLVSLDLVEEGSLACYDEAMAEPERGSLFAELKRDQMHSRDIVAALEFLRDALDREDIPFGLIGGLALRHHGYTRFTEDIDILTSPEGLDRIHVSLIGRGLRPRAEGLRKKLRQTEFKVDIDVVTSGEHAGSDESPTIYPDPESDAFVDREGIRVVTLQKLVEFKVASGVWGHRLQDLVDVQKLTQANGLTESFAEKLPEPLRAKFLELLAESRLERDLE